MIIIYHLASDYVFTTAHSSKGLEFNTVSIEDDFLEGLDPGKPSKKHEF